MYATREEVAKPGPVSLVTAATVSGLHSASGKKEMLYPNKWLFKAIAVNAAGGTPFNTVVEVVA